MQGFGVHEAEEDKGFSVGFLQLPAGSGVVPTVLPAVVARALLRLSHSSE